MLTVDQIMQQAAATERWAPCRFNQNSHGGCPCPDPEAAGCSAAARTGGDPSVPVQYMIQRRGTGGAGPARDTH